MLIALLAVPCFVRFFFLNRKKSISLAGLLQDLLFVFQELHLLILVSLLPGGKALAGTIAYLLQAYLLLDGFLYSATGLRMRLSFFSYFSERRTLRDSFRAEGIKKFYFSLFLLLLYNTGLFSLLSNPVPAFSWFFLLCMGGLAMMVGILAKSTPGQQGNALILEEIALIAYLFTKKQVLPEQNFSLPKTEKYELLAAQFPLLRSTKGFLGEKTFSIRVEREEKPHVVFLCMESWQAKEIGCLGSKKGATSCFDLLAEKGILFSQFYAHGGKTYRALLATLFGIPTDTGNKSLIENLPLLGLPQLMRNVGYQSAYLHGNYKNVDTWQLEFMKNHGFDVVLDKNQIEALFPDAISNSWGVHDAYLLDYASDWLHKQDSLGRPTFLVLPTISTHHPWNIPALNCSPEFNNVGKRYEHYLKALHYSDKALGNFIKSLTRNGLSERTLFFIFGDHGCIVEEQNARKDTPFCLATPFHLYEEIVHVPLLILGEGRIEKPMCIADICGQVDLLPTLLDLLKIEGMNHGAGDSLLRKRENQIIYLQDSLVPSLIGCRSDSYKYILNKQTREEELYDLKKDPEEKRNIAGNNPDIVHRLQQRVESYFCFFDWACGNQRLAPGDSTQTEWAYKQGDLIDAPFLASLLQKNRSLEQLNLAECLLIRDEELRVIAQYGKNLKRLNLSNCSGISDQGITEIAQSCPHLQVVDLTRCTAISDAGIRTLLENSKELEQLKLRGIPGLSDNIWEGLKGKNHSLYQLDLLGIVQVTDVGLKNLAEAFPQLRVLFLSAPLITDRGIEIMAKKCRYLTNFCLQHAPLTDAGLTALFSANAQLEFLLLEGCKKITGSSFAFLAPSSLTLLQISDSPELTDEALFHLRKSEISLLSLSNCPKITDKGFLHLEELPLENCFFSHCANISQAAVNRLKEKKKDAIVLFI